MVSPTPPASPTLPPLRPSLTILIPAFNEEAAIERVLDEVRRETGCPLPDVIVIDDGSTDETARRAEAAGARVIRHRSNQGYGAALKTGIRAATSEWVLTMDSDGQHRAVDVLALSGASGDYDLVIGARVGGGGSPLWRRPGKWVLGFLVRRILRRPVPDFNSGLRLMRREVALRYLHVCPSGFSFSTTITMAFLSRGCQVGYVPIECRPRTGTSRVTPRTGLETAILVLRIACLFHPLRLFLPASALLAATGVAWGLPYLARGSGLTVAALLLLVSSMLVLMMGLVCDQISSLRLERFE